MCGINGFNFEDTALITAMNDRVAHRGPDGEGVYCDAHVSLGHRRLAILDLSAAGHQPMHSADGRFIIVFNGEIYNFQELKARLRGYPFRSNSDTEVILAAYERWGKECVQQFNGIFAFAIYDTHSRELFCARDQLGVKPLYYYYDGDRFIFSSEIKGILTHPVARQLDHGALNMYFRLLYVPAPRTPWQHIHKLPPAHYAVFKEKALTVRRYWSPEQFDTLSDRNEIQERLRQTFTQAVDRQLISDRPVGLYLSGGIDSTALLGVMAEKRAKPIDTFSVGFEVEQDQQDKFNADFDLAAKTAQHFNTNHHRVTLTARAVRENFERMVWHMDDLVANHAQPAMYRLAALAAPEVAVVLAGEGGDELFGGYSRYYLSNLIDRFQMLPRPLRQNALVRQGFALAGKSGLYEKINTPPGLDRWLEFMVQKEAVVGNFLQPAFDRPAVTRDFLAAHVFADLPRMAPVKAFQYADMRTWLADDALNRGDRMGMAHGVEVRVPFLDVELVTLALAIPSRYMLGTRDQGKVLLKEALRSYIPESVYHQPKRGFFSPMAKWLRGDLREWAREILSSGYNEDLRDIIDFAAVEDIVNKHVSGERYALNTIWSLLTFQVWYKSFNKG